MSQSKDEIKQLMESYFAEQAGFNGEGMLKYWHPEGVMYLVGNQGEFRVVTIEEQVSHMAKAKEHMPDLSGRLNHLGVG